MTYALLTISLTILAICCAWLSAYRRGRESAELELNSLSAAEGMAYFIRKEIYRHELDAAAGRRDLKRLERMGVTIPKNIPLNVWVRVHERREP